MTSSPFGPTLPKWSLPTATSTTTRTRAQSPATPHFAIWASWTGTPVSCRWAGSTRTKHPQTSGSRRSTIGVAAEGVRGSAVYDYAEPTPARFSSFWIVGLSRCGSPQVPAIAFNERVHLGGTPGCYSYHLGPYGNSPARLGFG